MIQGFGLPLSEPLIGFEILFFRIFSRRVSFGKSFILIVLAIHKDSTFGLLNRVDQLADL